ITRLLVQMEDQERMHTEGIAEIHLILNKHLQTQFFEHLKEQAQQEIDREIHELVRDQVALCLEAHISQELQDEVARNRRELEDLRLQLHNSESRRANSLLRSNQPNDPLHTIYTSNGQVSAHFPKSLGDLFNLDAETCRCLVLDYELPVSDSRDRNLNLFMRFCGVGYQVVCFSTHPCTGHTTQHCVSRCGNYKRSCCNACPVETI
ncbi:hypothetical protein L208DRAFT_1333016, partial [Tricholoma matsutake]